MLKTVSVLSLRILWLIVALVLGFELWALGLSDISFLHFLNRVIYRPCS